MVLVFLENIFVFLLGLCIGSFLNCVVYRRLPASADSYGEARQEKSLGGRSFCPQCRRTLAWYDLFPVFSFVFLGGKCRYCKKKISWQYPVVEAATALIFLLIFNFSALGGPASGWQFLNLAFLFYVASALIVIFVYDLKHYLIPDKVLFPAIIVAFIYRLFEIFEFRIWNLFRISDLGFRIYAPLLNYFYAALIGFGFFLAIFLISRGRWMGFGDVKLAVLMGFLLGFPNILVALFLAFFFGAIIGIILMLLQRKGLKSEIPFGPFLILGTFIAMLWGGEIINWYLTLFKI